MTICFQMCYSSLKGSCACGSESQTDREFAAKGLLQGAQQGNGDKPQNHSNLTLKLGVFLKGKTKEARLTIFLWHILIRV